MAAYAFCNIMARNVIRKLLSDFNCMALSNSGALLAAATADCIITVWELANNADGEQHI